MGEWWDNLPAVTRWFYGGAAFFSVFFLWQLIAAFMGLSAGDEADVDADVDADAVEIEAAEGDASLDAEVQDAADTMAAFRFLSIRSALAFCTLFCWAGALYLDAGTKLTPALLYSVAWGFGAMAIVALIFHMMRRLTETGSPRIASCVGTTGTVYYDIPADGRGHVRVTVSGVLSHLKARSAEGAALKAGTPIRVVRVLGPTTVEVEPVGREKAQGKDGES